MASERSAGRRIARRAVDRIRRGAERVTQVFKRQSKAADKREDANIPTGRKYRYGCIETSGDWYDRRKKRNHTARVSRRVNR